MDLKRKTECAGNKSKKQRSAITLEEKLTIIRLYEEGKLISTIARDKNRPISTVNTIVKDKDRILESMKGAVTLKGTIITKKRLGPISEMEKLLSYWIEDMAQNRIPLSFPIIQEKARSLHKDLQEKAGIEDPESAFKASAGWFERFKKRSNLHSMQITGEAASEDADAASKFSAFLAEIIVQGEYLPDQIFNVDETALYWKRMPTRTFIAQEEKSMPGFKVAKDRITVMFGCNISGDLKLKPLTVYHSQRPRVFKNIYPCMLPVIWKSNTNACVTRVLFADWFNNHFIPQVKEYCAKKGIPFKVLLLLDHALGHPEELDDFNSDVKVVYLPPRTATLLRPMGQGAIAIFKGYYLRRTFSQAIKAVDSGQGITLRDFWKNYNILDGIKNIRVAWDEVKQTTMNAVWQKLCPEMVRNCEDEEPARTDTVFELTKEVQQVTETCVQLAGKLALEVDIFDVTELLLSHDEELTNDDLIQLEAFRNSEENTMPIETPTADVKKFTTKGLALAFNLIDMGLAKLESMDPNTERFENVSRRIHSDMSSYIAIYDDKKNVTTTSSLDNFVRRLSQQRQDGKPDNPVYPQPSTSRGVEVARRQHFSSQPSTSNATSPTTEPNSLSQDIFLFDK